MICFHMSLQPSPPTAPHCLLPALSNMVGGGPVTLVQRKLQNLRLELKTGKTRGANPRALTPEEIQARELRRDDLVSRMTSRINAHATAEADRSIGAVNEHTSGVVVAEAVGVKQAFVRTFCPELPVGAPAKEQLRLMKVRRDVERGVMSQLQGQARAEALEKKTSKASSSGGGGKQRETVTEAVAEEIGGKRVCGELCRGTKQKPGKRCRVTNLPCRFHAVPTASEPSEIAKRIDLAEVADEEVAEPAAESTKKYVHPMTAAEVWEENLKLL